MRADLRFHPRIGARNPIAEGETAAPPSWVDPLVVEVARADAHRASDMRLSDPFSRDADNCPDKLIDGHHPGL